jgi:pantoate--beta-alanine ligase
MQVISSPEAMTAWSLEQRAAGHRIGFVPTMGYLHAGHASLVDLARNHSDRVVVSIFVNPLQFGPGEDLDRYPRDADGDLATCERHGAAAVFMPPSLYPPDFVTTVRVSGLTERLCGAHRPGHFEGVTTVVARLFGIVRPHIAVFGEKDYQQLAVIRRMSRDLALGVEIVPGPLVRDRDGLALSSRNRYLSADERRRGLSLSRALRAMRGAESDDVHELLRIGRDLLELDRLDYLEVVCADSLEPLERLDRPARALVAGFVGATRLIDGMDLEPRA